MFSSDKNIETIGQLIEAIRHYIGLQTKYAKLDVIEKIVRLLTAFVMMITLVLLMLMLIYASFAAAFALQPFIGAAAAFCVVAGTYFIALILCFAFRKQWIERPLVKFLASILMQE